MSSKYYKSNIFMQGGGNSNNDQQASKSDDTNTVGSILSNAFNDLKSKAVAGVMDVAGIQFKDDNTNVATNSATNVATNVATNATNAIDHTKQVAANVAANAINVVGNSANMKTVVDAGTNVLNKFNNTMNNPDTINAVKQTVNNANILLDAAKEPIKKVVGQIGDDGAVAAGKIGKAATNALANVAEAVPGVGAVVGALRIANNAVQIGEAVEDNTKKTLDNVYGAINDVATNVKDQTERVTNNATNAIATNIKDQTERVTNNATNAIANNVTNAIAANTHIVGGNIDPMSIKIAQRGGMKTMNRIEKSIAEFTNNLNKLTTTTTIRRKRRRRTAKRRRRY